MVVRAYTAHIRVTLECRWMELGVIGDGWGRADKVYHDTATSTLYNSKIAHYPFV